ncbi:sulfate ABC transporter substrate-binding protein [Lichenicoccus roseus]|uniref:Sulfate ABC transporter substrate-binding protein n=1 Tax=Lichenicoccus roseus TaxID=2683649 RepID=A0A5R9J1P2_9PROT|nr:sulfate ABC transporter substrate-binding protein [Lichenicoccus roseus]
MALRSLSGVLAMVLAIGTLSGAGARAADLSLLNVSYDPTRELYKDVNQAFAAQWKAKSGQTVEIKTSHGGSGAQARAVMDGLQADVVTLGLAWDIDVLTQRHLLAADWEGRLPNHSVPYTSTVVFLVRHGNPKHLAGWTDLVRDGVEVITPNPKTSSGGRWSYLAAYTWALHQPGASEASAESYLGKLYKHVPVLDTGARGATNTFVQRGEGDVLLAWEDEALLAAHDVGDGQFDVVYPASSIKAEPPVAWVDSVTDKKRTGAVAQAYLRFLFNHQGQELAAKHHYRPIDPAVFAEHKADFPAIKVYDVASLGGWPAVQAKHFADGGVFDSIYSAGK